MPYRIHGLATPIDPSLAPDGSTVALTVSTVDVADDLYERVVWVVTPEEGRPLTRGPGDRSPRWSPDGSRLAFLRAEGDQPPQLAVIPVDGGEAVVVTDFALGVASEPRWSPDGATIAVVGEEWTQDWAGLDEHERGRRPRRITRRDYRADDRGWTHDRERLVYLVDPTGREEPRRLTTGRRDEAAPVWSPDGASLAFLTDRTETTGFRIGASICRADVVSGEIRRVAPHGAWNVLAYRPDGVLHALGTPVVDRPDHAGVWRLDAEQPTALTEGLDRAMFSFAVGAPRLVFDGDVAHVSIVDRGALGLVAVAPDGRVEERHTGRFVVTGFDVAAGTTAITVSEVDTPGRLEIHRGDDVAVHQDFGGAPVERIRPHHFTVDGPGGELDVWVYLPDGDEPVPLLLNIHGGPSSQYGWGFFDEFQTYVGAGYGVVATNPRGSTGGDRAFLQAVIGEGWGEVDVEDVDLVVEAALRRHERLDPDRMGVMGGSYGGFLTAWLIAHQRRWKVAVVERALLNWASFRGTSDIGGWFGPYYGIEGDRAWEVSPQRLAADVATPTLVIHSENDLRCPIEQAEQYFAALVENGVEAELVRFPDEGHELSRSGSPRHREERFDIVLDWLGRWLGVL